MAFSLKELTDSGHKAPGKILHHNETIIKIKVRAHPTFSAEEKINFLWEDKRKPRKERMALSVKLKSLALTL